MFTRSIRSLAVLLLVAFLSLVVTAQTGKAIYTELGTFTLVKSARVDNYALKVDRVTMTLTGTLYFTAPLSGRHTGAVFIGNGKFSAPVPDTEFEKAYVRRLLKTDVVESDFTSAVFRMTDGSLDSIATTAQTTSPPPEAQKLALEHNPKLLKETGANISARLAVSINNSEKAGLFVATFYGGRLDDFSYVFDPLTRIPTANFDLNGGEKGLIFTDRSSIFSTEVLMAFYSLSDYQRRTVDYSDLDDLVDITSYDIELDLRSPRSKISERATIKMTTLTDGVAAIPFNLGESLGRYYDERLKKQLRVGSVKYLGTPIEFSQQDWEGGFTVYLPSAVKRDTPIELEISMSGDFLTQPELQTTSDFSYPRSAETWYPRHGYLDRSQYKFQFIHPKRLKVVCVGQRISEAPSAEDKDFVVTRYQIDEPISLATFALGPYERHNETAKWDGTEDTLPLEFNSISDLPLKESFVLAELSNSVRYFHKLFGAYPYKTYAASYHPYQFGQGFPSMLMIPRTDHANKFTYSFIAHETAHQWWGNIVAWRSYRDQWLSEGFAEYSGVLYTRLRDSPKAAENLIDNMRASLRRPPETLSGQGKGKLNDVGPIIQGHRLDSSKTFGGYSTLVYNKGALVLRMLHFLFTDPNTGNGDAFYDMMKDFVARYRNQTASTDDFRSVANEHFAKTPIARRYQIKDLNWFFQQWVYETHMPSYTMEYAFEPQPDGSVMVTGNVYQENVPDNFFMPLPVLFTLGDKFAAGTVAALGPKTPFKIKLPVKPTKVEFDPSSWVLSEKTSMK